jgi:predicted permease
VKNPHELALIDFEDGSTRPGNWFSDGAVATYAEWDQIRAQQQAFSGILAWNRRRFNLANGGEPRYAQGLFVSGDYFRVLGVNAVLGRTLTAQDDTKTCNAGAVISYPFWQREFGGDSAVLGRSVSLNGFSFPVIGVTPESFFGLEVGTQFDIAMPLCADTLMDPDHIGRSAMATGYWLSVAGRLKPGWTIKRTTAQLHTISPGIMQATLTAHDGSTGLSSLRTQYERSLWLLMAITGLVLLIACANLANLLLARATVREPEIAVRLALGASRGRLIQQLLAESLLLAIAGTVAGVTLAMVLSRALIAFISPSGNPVFVDTRPDAEVLLYSVAMAVLTCVLFGLAPALRSSHLSPASAMRAGGRSVTAGREHFGLRRMLVTTQVALSLVLLFGALLFVRSFRNLLTTDPGFRAEGLLAVR